MLVIKHFNDDTRLQKWNLNLKVKFKLLCSVSEENRILYVHNKAQNSYDEIKKLNPNLVLLLLITIIHRTAFKNFYILFSTFSLYGPYLVEQIFQIF